jgi:hypothetical protein
MRIAFSLLGLAFLGASTVAQAPAQESSALIQVRSLTIISKDLPGPERVKVAHAFEGRTCPLLEISSRVKAELSDLGYAEATAEIPRIADLLSVPPATPADITVLVTLGARYRIDRIVIKGAMAFPRDEITPQFPVVRGDLFNATAIGRGLDNIRKLYASKGYMNFGAFPTLQYDEIRHTVVLTINIDEGKRAGSGV